MVTHARTVAAIGNFDGVHRGHRQLIEQTAAFAEKSGAPTGVVVFDPHPQRFFRPDAPSFLITTARNRDRLLVEAGADIVMSLAFDHALASLSPQAFVVEILRDQLHLSGVVVGAEFRFGAGRAGDAKMLAALCDAVGLTTLIVTPEPFADGDGKIGSSAIRQAIAVGEMGRAADMLGRRWVVDGVVDEGKRLGRTIGFATANLSLGELIEPRRGVYAVRVSVDGRQFDGVANFGRKPTVGSTAPLLEAHLFSFEGDLYGQTIAVEFEEFIRDERKFDGLDQLKAQIAQDCDAARKILRRS